MGRFISGSDSAVPYSDRKAMRDELLPWPIEDIVAAQRMHCEGVSVEEICTALGRGRDEVMKLLSPEDAPQPRQRPERANVGFSYLKGRR
jgi:hypothetical protein